MYLKFCNVCLAVVGSPEPEHMDLVQLQTVVALKTMTPTVIAGVLVKHWVSEDVKTCLFKPTVNIILSLK